MRNLFDGSRRGRRPARPGSVPTNSSPYDFGTADDERVDPVDLMAIRADDELLDALASGGVSFGGFGSGVRDDLDGGFHDDKQMLAMLAAWRDEVIDEPVPDLVTVEQASEAIVSGQRSAYPKRRLMPVAAAAAAVVLGMSGVAIGAGTAEPGDALWGVSKTLDSDRAESKEAAQRVSVALASVQQALDEGRVKDAQVTLAAIAPVIEKVTDEETKNELARKQANLTETAGDAKEGEKVHTDESGKRDDHKDKSKDAARPGDPKPGDAKAGDPKPGDPKAGDEKPGDPKPGDPKAGDPKSGDAKQGDPKPGDEKAGDPKADPRRGAAGPPREKEPSPATTTNGKPTPTTSPKTEPSKASGSPTDSGKPQSKPDTTKESPPKDTGEGEGSPVSPTPNAMPPPGPPTLGPPGP